MADLLVEDLAKPFKLHLKDVHSVIIFILDHDVLYGIFSGYAGVKGLTIPQETRFATEVICVDSLLVDKALVVQVFVEPQVDLWLARSSTKPDVRAKFRRIKALVMDEAFWHKSAVFSAVCQIPVLSLRILDSDKPNLKDAAFAWERMTIEFNVPLLGRLAAIPDYGQIDLFSDLESEHLGTLSSYISQCLATRKGDWLSDPVLAAAAVNPAYAFAVKEEHRWTIDDGGGAVRRVFSKLSWGVPGMLNLLLDGWERYSSKEGVYAEQVERLSYKAEDPVAFFRHVFETSTLECDRVFASTASKLLCQFAKTSRPPSGATSTLPTYAQRKGTTCPLIKARTCLR